MTKIKRMSDRKIITLTEWTQVNVMPDGSPIKAVTSKTWARRGHLQGAYQSPPDKGVYLLPADCPVPQLQAGAASHRNNKRAAREAKLIKAGEV